MPEYLSVDTDLLDRAADAFAGIRPWRGFGPKRRGRNFLGAVWPDESAQDETDFEEIEMLETELPSPRGGEGFFEFYSLINSVKDARDRYVAVSLGAHDGRPLVNAALAVRRHNPMPVKLVGVEGDQHMCEKLRGNFIANGINPLDHTLINAVVSGDNKPLLFPTTEVRTGANVSIHTQGQRESLYEIIQQNNLCDTVLRSLLVNLTTGLKMPLTGVGGVEGELELKSSLTVADVLSVVDRVDYLEVDIQMSEKEALPPAADMMSRKVRWAHIGTHGHTAHDMMVVMFREMRWDILADVLPQTQYQTPDGPFTSQDGVVVARNPRI